MSLLRNNFFFVLSMFFVAAGSGFSTSMHIEEGESRSILPQGMPVLTETEKDEPVVAIMPAQERLILHDQPETSVPSMLTLSNSLQLRSLCELFQGDLAAEQMNNIFTNIAYDQALALYAQHGDRFIKPFANYIIGSMYGVVENGVKRATGTSDLFSVVGVLTGKKFTLKSEATALVQKSLSQDIIDILRLKFVTDLANRHIVGPYIVAPNVAFAVNTINLGKIIQTQLFNRLHSQLCGYENELVIRSERRMGEIASEICVLLAEIRHEESSVLEGLDAKTLFANQVSICALEEDIKQQELENKLELGIYNYKPLRGSTEKEKSVEILRQYLNQLQGELKPYLEKEERILELKSNVEKLKKESVDHASALEAVRRYYHNGSAIMPDEDVVSLLQRPEYDLRELFCGLPLVGDHIDSYMKACPHIQPGFLSSLMTQENLSVFSQLPRGYLRLTGVLGSVDALHDDLSPVAFQRTYAAFINNLADAERNTRQLSQVNFVPSAEALADKGLVGSLYIRGRPLCRVLPVW